jgi:hypothetical protein
MLSPVSSMVGADEGAGDEDAGAFEADAGVAIAVAAAGDSDREDGGLVTDGDKLALPPHPLSNEATATPTSSRPGKSFPCM